jgi:hypothetical protein
MMLNVCRCEQEKQEKWLSHFTFISLSFNRFFHLFFPGLAEAALPMQ